MEKLIEFQKSSTFTISESLFGTAIVSEEDCNGTGRPMDGASKDECDEDVLVEDETDELVPGAGDVSEQDEEEGKLKRDTEG